MIQASGMDAEHWSVWLRAQAKHIGKWHGTRIDIARDFLDRTVSPAWLHDKHLEEEFVPRARKVARFIGVVNDGVAFGSRSSDFYVRCYDKGLERKSAEKGAHVRVEFETKGELSRAIWRAFIHTDTPLDDIYYTLCKRNVDEPPAKLVAGLYNPQEVELTVPRAKTNTEQWFYQTVLKAYSKWAMNNETAAYDVLNKMIDEHLRIMTLKGIGGTDGD
jgi:hypothetical protein